MTSADRIHGFAEIGFGGVADAFADATGVRGETGGAVAVLRDGVPVVDLWGGLADERTGRPWGEHTTAVIFSCTKGGMTIAAYQLVQGGLLDPDARGASDLPGFRHGRQGPAPGP